MSIRDNWLFSDKEILDIKNNHVKVIAERDEARRWAIRGWRGWNKTSVQLTDALIENAALRRELNETRRLHDIASSQAVDLRAELDAPRQELSIIKDHNKRLLRNLGLEIGIDNLLMADWLTQEEKDILIELQNE